MTKHAKIGPTRRTRCFTSHYKLKYEVTGLIGFGWKMIGSDVCQDDILKGGTYGKGKIDDPGYSKDES